MRFYIAVTACWLTAQLGYYSQTQLLTPIMKSYNIDATAVGVMLSIEIFTFAIVALFMAGPITKLPKLKIGLISSVALVGCNVIAAYAITFDVLMGARVLAGISAGILGAVGTVSAATSHQPQRTFAILVVASGLGFAVNAVVFPYFTTAYNATGGYMLMALVASICTLFLPWLTVSAQTQKRTKSKDYSGKCENLSQSLFAKLGILDAPNKSIAMLAFLALIIYEIGQSALQVYLEQFGTNIGMDIISTGETIGIVGAFGLLGGIIAYYVGSSFGNLRPVLLGVLINASMGFALPLSSTGAEFAIYYLFWNISFYFLLPYIFGLITELDKKGRWTVAADAIWWLGAAPGAAIGAIAVNIGGFASLSILAISTGIISMTLFFFTMQYFYLNDDANRQSL